MHKPSNYLHLRAWGIRLGSFNSYILQQQYLASEDNAPLNAIYRDTDGSWITDIPNPNVRRELEASVRWLIDNDPTYYPMESER